MFNSKYKMANVTEKQSTYRRAIARGFIKMAPSTTQVVAEKRLPKGDALAMAEVAGILGAKKTIEILPLCHPLPIESVRIQCDLRSDGVSVTCEVITTYKTGVEMEALMGVNAALLCIYDLTKPVDPLLSIHDVHLVLKEGGKSGLWRNPEALEDPIFESAIDQTRKSNCAPSKSLHAIKAAVITISDRCSKKQAEDSSGPLLKQMLEDREAQVLWSEIVPDEVIEIQKVITRYKELGADLIISTGGTGFSPRDVTPEAIEPMLTKKVDGFGELFRSEGAKHISTSYLSRSISGFIGDTLIVALPGSPRACRDGVDILGDLIPHAIHIAKGGHHGGAHEINK